jgi:hypothetical protein
MFGVPTLRMTDLNLNGCCFPRILPGFSGYANKFSFWDAAFLRPLLTKINATTSSPPTITTVSTALTITPASVPLDDELEGLGM